jgi:hypothetical protein
MDQSIASGKVVVPVYPGDLGVQFIGKELAHLDGLGRVQELRDLGACLLHDNMYDESMRALAGQLRREASLSPHR